VTVARPAIAPVTMPIEVGLPILIRSTTSQEMAAAQAARWVFMIADEAESPAASAEPPLKPYQPTQSRPAPVIVKAGECGGRSVLLKPLRGLIIHARISAAMPAVVWTTMPPAKSSVPPCCNQPPPHTQCATGT
jgi:hypothetical protein